MYSVLTTVSLPVLLVIGFIFFTISNLVSSRDFASYIWCASAGIAALFFGYMYSDVQVPIHAYGTMMLVGFIFGSLVLSRNCRQVGINKEFASDTAVMVLFAGIIGARLLYFVEDAASRQKLFEAPWTIIQIWEGGLTFYGGLIFAGFVLIYLCRKNKIPVMLFMDAVSPAIILGLAFGRIGCLLNGCCYGVETASSFSLQFPENVMTGVDHTIHVVPTQPISTAYSLLIFFVLLALFKRRKFDGYVFVWLGLLYSIARFIIEFWRGDNVEFLLGMTISQFISMIIFIMSVLFYFYLKKNGQGPTILPPEEEPQTDG